MAVALALGASSAPAAADGTQAPTAGVVASTTPVPAVGAPSAPNAQSAASVGEKLRKGEAELLVAPGGGAFEVPIHVSTICTFMFPGEVTASAIRSSPTLEVNAWNNNGIAVRALPGAKTSTLAISTKSGAVAVNLTLRIVAENEEAFTLVRFRAVSAEEAFEARLAAELAKRVAPIEARLEAARKRLDQDVRDRSESDVMDYAIKRNETIALHSHGRNDNHVIAHVERALVLGDDAYLFFEIENRSTAPFRLAKAVVSLNGAVVSGPVRLRSASVNKDPTVIGVVAASASARGVALIRNASPLIRKSLTLELADVGGHGTIRVDKGIVLP